MTPDYGIDAPGVRRGMLAVGIGALAVSGIVGASGTPVAGLARVVAIVVAGGMGIAAAYGLGMAGYMTYASRVGKMRTRERLLDLVAWTGREAVLDVGCGRGLMLVGAARRLTDGTAIGVDLWRAEDQAGNTPEAALENARREDVAERVKIQTGDARVLDFADACFDIVLSHWVVHNLPNAPGRMQALDEMLRVLRPGGTLILADIGYHAEYLGRLAARGVTNVNVLTGGFESRIIGALSGGSFRPRAIVARKAMPDR